MSAAFRLPLPQYSTQVASVVEEITCLAGPLPQISLNYEPETRLLWINLKPEPKPVFTLPVVESVGKVQVAIMQLWGRAPDRPVHYMAYRSSARVFSLGGDLDYYLDCLRSNDREGLRTYADRATEVIRLNRNGLDGSVITLANVRGKAIGGGIDPARACNVMIAEEGATFCYPEVNFNHFPISAVPVLSRHVGPMEAENILLSGAEYSAEDFMAKGALDALVPSGSGDDWIRAYASRTSASHSARIALIGAFNRMAGELDGPLAACAQAWADHIMSLRPIEIAKLQRIAAAQERMLGRLLREEVPCSPVC